MSIPIRLVLVEDHALQLEGLVMLLKNDPDLEVVKSMTDAKIFIQEWEKLDFDILLADLHMPEISGLDLAEAVKKSNPKLKTILLTMQRGTRFMQRAEKLGVDGYLLKSIAIDELKSVIKKIHSGEKWYDPEIKNYTQEDDTQIKSTLTVSEKPENLLSEREREILVLVCQEYSSAQIGEKLFISTGTVDTHRKNILVKLGVTNTVGLVKYALKHGLLNQ